MIKEVLAAICKKLMPISLPTPTIKSMQQVANDYNEIWNFPNCCRAVAGKHCRICPYNSGSLYFNYMPFFSTCISNFRYKVIWVDIG